MAHNLAHQYSDAMRKHPYGHALLVPESSTALVPSACGYIDSLGRWQPIAFIDDEDGLKDAGLSLPGPIATRSPSPHQWGPKAASSVDLTKFGLDLGSPDIPAGFPVSVKVVLDFQSSSDFGAILHCGGEVTHEGYFHRYPFKKWAKENAEALLKAVPDVKEHGFWVVTDTYSTTDVSVVTWTGEGKHVQMGFHVDMTPAGEIGPSGEFFRGRSAGAWERTTAKDGESLVVFFSGVQLKYRRLPLLFGKATVREVRGDEEPVVVSDENNELYEVECDIVGTEEE